VLCALDAGPARRPFFAFKMPAKSSTFRAAAQLRAQDPGFARQFSPIGRFDGDRQGSAGRARFPHFVSMMQSGGDVEN